MEYRAYFFGNMYLSSIQQGIQAAHVTADMFVKYDEYDIGKRSILNEWAANHKTMVLLNAGYSSEIERLIETFESSLNPYPWDYFTESEDALNGATTSVGIILPEQIYIGAKQIRERLVDPGEFVVTQKVKWDTPEIREYEVSDWEVEFIMQLNNYGLAK